MTHKKILIYQIDLRAKETLSVEVLIVPIFMAKLGKNAHILLCEATIIQKFCISLQLNGFSRVQKEKTEKSLYSTQKLISLDFKYPYSRGHHNIWYSLFVAHFE